MIGVLTEVVLRNSLLVDLVMFLRLLPGELLTEKHNFGRQLIVARFLLVCMHLLLDCQSLLCSSLHIHLLLLLKSILWEVSVEHILLVHGRLLSVVRVALERWTMSNLMRFKLVKCWRRVRGH